MDCWIAASAVALEGVLVTEDTDLPSVMGSIPETSTVPCWTWTELQQQI
jgi:predicted nucleic acid-binding protein